MANYRAFVQACNNVQASQVQVWADLVTDLTNIRTALVGVTAQLDADAGVTGTTFGSANNPAALKTRTDGVN